MDKKRRTELTFYEKMELVIGTGGRESKFPSEDARREAWETHREELLARRLRPWAADLYEPAEDTPSWETGA